MLYLQSADTNGSARTELVPVAELTALALERALLAGDRNTRCANCTPRSPAIQPWPTGRSNASKARSGLSPPSLGDAVTWLAGCLETELSVGLINANGDKQHREIESRLPALARRLAEYERQLADVDARLEREKLESMKELAYGASHEINNPLANIAARAQTLLEEEAKSGAAAQAHRHPPPGDARPRDDRGSDAVCPPAKTEFVGLRRPANCQASGRRAPRAGRGTRHHPKLRYD